MLKQEKVKPSAIKIDYSYQRPTDDDRVAQIAANYDPDRVGVPVVSRRPDGSLYGLDGAHRIKANVACGRGDTPILCLVHDGLTYEEEAGWFVLLNGDRVAVDAVSKYRARVASKDPVATEISKIMKSFGLVVAYASGTKAVSAIGAVESVHRKHGNLPAVLSVLTRWAKVNEAALEGVLIKAVAAFLVQYPEADIEHLCNKLIDVHPRAAITDLREQKKHFAGWAASCMVIRSFYNKNLRTPSKILPPVNA